jgi:nucleoside-diphosphate-sugar epimerase
MAHYLVTGGAGFIGSHLAEELVRRGETVRVVDNLSTGKRQNLSHVPSVEFIEGDLADLEVARRAVKGIDYVLHQAAIPSVPRSVEDPITSNRANIDATLNVLVAARDAGVKRLVYAGSSSAYGNTPTLPKVENGSGALSLCARLVAEQYCRCYAAVRTVHAQVLNVSGCGGSLVATPGEHLYQRALRGRLPTIYGDSEHVISTWTWWTACSGLHGGQCGRK